MILYFPHRGDMTEPDDRQFLSRYKYILCLSGKVCEYNLYGKGQFRVINLPLITTYDRHSGSWLRITSNIRNWWAVMETREEAEEIAWLMDDTYSVSSDAHVALKLLSETVRR